jgi:hypothetical protein
MTVWMSNQDIANYVTGMLALIQDLNPSVRSSTHIAFRQFLNKKPKIRQHLHQIVSTLADSFNLEQVTGHGKILASHY